MRLESALEIIGALKRRFGEPITVTDICRDVALSYQPVYATVRRLADRGVLSVRKAGQRAFCEPTATPSGSLWLAHWSLEELGRARGSDLGELIAALEGRITADVSGAGLLAALDPGAGPDRAVYTTDAALGSGLAGVRARLVTRPDWPELLAGPRGNWAVARRIIPLSGHQQLWELALAAREQSRAEPAPRPLPPVRRREFVD